MAAIIVEGWTARSFIGKRATEDFTQEELDTHFKKLLDKAFFAIGYVPVEDQDELNT